jgi:anionic cell wall polymer biosynthesis LytR-Cps2A-Psr (LCP) family protein
MRNILKAVGVLILIGVLIGFFVSDNSRYSVPDTQPNSALTETRSESKSDVQTTPTVEDPFKKFLDQKAGSSNTVTKSDKAQVVPVQPGKDPFKEFLDKQKQNSKDQVVSPFGKN